MLMHGAHHQDRLDYPVGLRRRPEARRDLSPEVRVHDILLNVARDAASQKAEIGVVQVSR